MKTGQYTVTEGNFRFRYLIHKVMPKTVEVSVLTSYNYSDFKGVRHYRYPKTLLAEQIENAEYLEFEN